MYVVMVSKVTVLLVELDVLEHGDVEAAVDEAFNDGALVPELRAGPLTGGPEEEDEEERAAGVADRPLPFLHPPTPGAQGLRGAGLDVVAVASFFEALAAVSARDVVFHNSK